MELVRCVFTFMSILSMSVATFLWPIISLYSKETPGITRDTFLLFAIWAWLARDIGLGGD